MLNITIWNDAGLLREYTHERYGERYHNYGLSGAAFGRMLRLAKRLSKLTGLTVEQIVDVDLK